MHVNFDMRIKLGLTSYDQLPVFLQGTSEAMGISHFQGVYLISGKQVIRTMEVDPNSSIQVLWRSPLRE